jgi:hypothetical protein
VWLDADARVRKPPVLLCHLRCDFACHHRRGELLSGTLYFAPTPAATVLAEWWCRAQQVYPGEWDQRVLAKVLPTVPNLRVHELPASYVRIFDGDDMGPEIIVEHLQASRRLAHA